jgi:hypothetical protein
MPSNFLIGTPQQRSKVTDSSVFFNGLALSPTDSARNLDVIFDNGLNFEKHISTICCSSFFQIRQIRQIRSSLDVDSAIIFASSLVHSKIDYCNSLLHALPASSIVRLQHVQNSLHVLFANRLVFVRIPLLFLKNCIGCPCLNELSSKLQQ